MQIQHRTAYPCLSQPLWRSYGSLRHVGGFAWTTARSAMHFSVGHCRATRSRDTLGRRLHSGIRSHPQFPIVNMVRGRFEAGPNPPVIAGASAGRMAHDDQARLRQDSHVILVPDLGVAPPHPQGARLLGPIPPDRSHATPRTELSMPSSTGGHGASPRRTPLVGPASLGRVWILRAQWARQRAPTNPRLSDVGGHHASGDPLTPAKVVFSTKRFGGTVGGNRATGTAARPICRGGTVAAQIGGTAAQLGGNCATGGTVAARSGGTAAQLGGNCATGGTAARSGGTAAQPGGTA
eukprot:gene16573-biopygen13601